jgi:hypothetical protein
VRGFILGVGTGLLREVHPVAGRLLRERIWFTKFELPSVGVPALCRTNDAAMKISARSGHSISVFHRSSGVRFATSAERNPFQLSGT